MKQLKNAFWVVIMVLFIAPVAALAFFSLPFSGWRALSVQTGSMVPRLPIGTVVIVHRQPASSFKIGDVITYQSLTKKISITHRIIQIHLLPGGYRQFITKGDANPTPDAMPVGERQVIGVMQYHIPGIGRAVDFVRTFPGLLLCVYLPAVLLASYEVYVLVNTLTKIKLEEYKGQVQAQQRALARLYRKNSANSGQPVAVMADGGQSKIIRPRSLPVILAVLVVCAFLGIGAVTTYALSTRSAELTNISISAKPRTGKPCKDPTILDLNFLNGDDETKPTITICASVCPSPGLTGWRLVGEEDQQNWDSSHMTINCTTEDSGSKPGKGDKYTLYNGDGHKLDIIRLEDNDER